MGLDGDGCYAPPGGCLLAIKRLEYSEGSSLKVVLTTVNEWMVISSGIIGQNEKILSF